MGTYRTYTRETAKHRTTCDNPHERPRTKAPTRCLSRHSGPEEDHVIIIAVVALIIITIVIILALIVFLITMMINTITTVLLVEFRDSGLGIGVSQLYNPSAPNLEP